MLGGIKEKDIVFISCGDMCATLVIWKIDDDDDFYEISIQNSYFVNKNGSNSIWARLKRAIKVFFQKPIYYNDIIVTEAEFQRFLNELNRKFLTIGGESGT